MFYSGILTESGSGGGGSKKDAELREAASLRQQRRMKQSVQFIHKDSADLLPLDGLKKLGTSKDTQPHNILQRRLLESNITKLRSSRLSWNPKGDHSTQSNKHSQVKGESPRRSEEEDALYVWGQCAGKEMKVRIDTSCQYSLISAPCLDRLGLKDHLRPYRSEEDLPLPGNVKAIGQVERLPLTLGKVAVECSALVTGNSELSVSLGLQALRALKCVINLEKNQLEVGRSDRDIIPLSSSTSRGRSSREERIYLLQWCDRAILQAGVEDSDRKSSLELQFRNEGESRPVTPRRNIKPSDTGTPSASGTSSTTVLQPCESLSAFRNPVCTNILAVAKEEEKLSKLKMSLKKKRVNIRKARGSDYRPEKAKLPEIKSKVKKAGNICSMKENSGAFQEKYKNKQQFKSMQCSGQTMETDDDHVEETLMEDLLGLQQWQSWEPWNQHP
ncbi:nuclear receptor-interacting protein 3 [Gastrophryne carolinensis]